MRPVVLVFVAILPACLDPKATPCADGRICPGETVCDDNHGTCVLPSQLVDCVDKADGTTCDIATIPAVCRDHVCVRPYCGDGVLDPGEECDGTLLGEGTCITQGFYDEPGLACTLSCTYDTRGCQRTCGDGMVDPEELCDGGPPEDRKCTHFGFDAGKVGCNTANCGPDFTDCKTIGWHDTDIDGPFGSVWASGENDIWVAGYGHVQHWDGIRWSEKMTGLVGEGVNKIWGTSANDVYAVSYSSFAHYDGTSWTVVHDDALGSLLSVGGSGPGDVYLVGWNGVFHGSGTSFSLVGSFDVSNLQPESIWAAAPNDVYIGGQRGMRHWNGTTWTDEFVGLQQSATNWFRGIWGSGPNDVYGVTVRGAIFHRTAAGWTRMAQPFDVGLYSIHGTGPNDIYAGGYNSIFHYDGHGWSLSITEGYVQGIFAIAPDHIIATSQTILESHGDLFFNDASPKYELEAIDARSPTEVHAVGKSGTIMGFDGARWKFEPTPIDADLHDVWDRYAVGDYGTILHFDGTKWVAMASNTTENLHAVYGFSANVVYAVGNNGTVRRYNGSTWTTITLPNAVDLFAIGGTSAASVVIGGAGGYVFTGNGSTWNSSTLASGQSVRDIGLVPAGMGNEVWLVGDAGTITRYAGTFSPIVSNTTADLRSIGTDANQNTRISTYHGLQYLLWNGGTMSAHQNGDGNLSPIPPVSAFSRTGDYACGEELGVLSVAGFSSWFEEVSPTTTQPFSGLTTVGPSDVYMLANYPSGLLYHFDGAITARAAVPTPNEVTAVWGLSANDVWASATGVFHWNGTTWSEDTSAPFLIATSIHGSGPNDVWMLGNNEGIHWNGTSWQTVALPTAPNGVIVDRIFATSPTTAFASCALNALTFAWNGTSWTKIRDADEIHGAQSMYATSTTDFYIGGYGALSHWDGTTWIDRDVGGTVGVSGTGPNDVFSTGSRLEHFDGELWSLVHPGRDTVEGAAIGGDTLWMRDWMKGSTVGLRRIHPW